jgi:hypothetical protein
VTGMARLPSITRLGLSVIVRLVTGQQTLQLPTQVTRVQATIGRGGM